MLIFAAKFAHMSKLTKLMLSLLLSVFSIALVKAQETTSEISGSISNNKEAVAGATITAIHTPTGTKYVTSSRKDGRYNLPNLRVGGPYTITATFVGFKEEKQENVFLSLGQEYKADFTLSAEENKLTEVVVATSRQNSVFNNGRTGSQETITRTQLERLPTISRSMKDFTKLEPTSNGTSFGGRSNQYNNITVDGANFNNSFGLGTGNILGAQTGAEPISLEAIEQIQVNVSPYDVRQGGFSGAGVNSITKSGTNQFRGSAYAYVKGAGTQGYNVDNVKVLKTPITYHIYGASLGGAIVKNKLFFFGSYEQVRQDLPATSLVPSDASHPASPGTYTQANADTMSAIVSFLKSKYGYDPTSGMGISGYSFKTNSDKITAKIDWNIDSKSTLTVKYNHLKSFSDQFPSASRPSGVNASTPGSPGTYSFPFYGAGYVINNNFNIYIAELNTRFSNRASNKLQVGYTALRDFRTPHSSSATFPFVDILSGGNILYSFGYEPYTYNNKLNTDVYQLSDIFTTYRGAHEITIGTQNYYRKYQNAFAPGYRGAFQFNSLQDFYSSANNGTINASSYYQQYSALKDGVFPWAYAGSYELSVFAQDKWRASKNFTLTYGLRFDYTIYKQAFTDNTYFDALKFKNGAQYNIGKAPMSNLVVSPRVGFNWDVKGDRSVQLRGGLGVFSGTPPFVWISNQASNNGIQFGNINTPVAFSDNPTVPSGTAAASYAAALVSHNFKYPTTLKTSLAVDKKLPDNWVITGEFSYSKDINAVYYSNINLNEEKGYAITNGGDTRTRYNPSFLASTSASNTKDIKYYSGTALDNPTLSTAILMDNTSKGYAYTATLRIQKTFRNLFLSGAYTYSDVKNTAEGGSTASSLWSGRAVGNADPNAPNLAHSSFYQPHRVIAFASYRFEYAKHFATSIGAIFEAAPSGVTSYVYNGDLNGDGNAGNDLIYIPRNSSDINLINVGSYSSTTHTGSTTGTATDPRTAAQIWTQLNNFIKQDHYLEFHRGAYAQANSVLNPWFKRLDLNLTQDISIKTGKNEKDRHTLRFTVDLINAGNLFNRNWGIIKTPSVSNFLRFEGMAEDGKTPLFSFPYADANNQVPLVNSYANSTSILSRWQMQFGFKYLFN